MIFENSENKQACVLLRVFRDDKPQFALSAAHELHVERVGSSLHLAKHNANEDTFAPWAVLSSWTWECMFPALYPISSFQKQRGKTL